MSGFLLLAAVYYSIEQAFCNEEEKQDCDKLATNNPDNSTTTPNEIEGERTRLLEEIPLQDLDAGLEEVITDFANTRNEPKTPSQGRKEDEGRNFNNSSDQGSEVRDDTTQSRSTSCVDMKAVVMDTNKVQSVNSSDAELSMPSVMHISESCIKDNVSNEKVVIQSPSLAVELSISSTPPITTRLPPEMDIGRSTIDALDQEVETLSTTTHQESSSLDAEKKVASVFSSSLKLDPSSLTSDPVAVETVTMKTDVHEKQRLGTHTPPFLHD